MVEIVTQKTIVEMDRPVAIETNPTGGLVLIMRKMPVKFEQIFDDKKMTYTLRATWSE